MPNHVTNRLFVVSGDPEALRRFIVKREGESEALDFNALVLMPESLNIEDGSIGEDGHDALFGNWRRAAAHARLSEAPCEIDSREDLIAFLREHRPETLELGQAYQDNLKAYGAKTWYPWRNQHWGTKWNAYDFEIVSPDCSELLFDTAWSVPEPIFHALAQALPKHTIRVYSFDKGHNFCAESLIKDGEAHVAVSEPLNAVYKIVYGREMDEDSLEEDSC